MDIGFTLLFVVGAGGSGHAVLRRLGPSFTNRIEMLCFSIATGSGVLFVSLLLLGLSHLLYAPIILGVAGLWVLLGCREAMLYRATITEDLRGFRPDIRSVQLWLVVLLVGGQAMGLTMALAPPHGATDPLAYQLALPGLFLHKHWLSFEPTITGALYPSNLGLLYIVCLALGSSSLAQVAHWLMGVLTCLALVGFCSRYLDWRSGLWAAVIFGFVPIVVVFGPRAYVDLGLCFFQVMAFWAVFNWVSARQKQTLVMAGLLTGLAMGMKHQGIATIFLGFPLVILASITTRRSWSEVFRNAVAYAGPALLVVSPWYIRGYLMAGNPVWPLVNGFFGGMEFGHSPQVLSLPARSSDGTGGLWGLVSSQEWLQAKWRSMSPWSWTFSPSGWQKAIGVYFAALVPGLVLYGRGKRVILLAGFCLAYYVALVGALHMNPRYGLVLIAFLSALCGHVAGRLHASGLPGLKHAFLVAFLCTGALNLCWRYVLARPAFDVATGVVSGESFLRRHEGNYRVFQFANRNFPDSAVVLLQGIVKGFYLRHSYIWDHRDQPVFRYEGCRNADDMLQLMRDHGITHIVRMIQIPSGRLGFYPQYFTDQLHEAFRREHLRLVYRDESYVAFEIQYPAKS